MIATAQRIQQVEEYYFSRKLKEIRQLVSEGKPIINLGIGSPDLPPSPIVTETLKEALAQPTAFSYQSYQGIPRLNENFKEFLSHQFSIEGDLASMPLLGSKKGITDISLAFLNQDEVALVPNPGYPTYASATKLAEGKVSYYSLTEAHNWHPNLEELEELIHSKVKILWINYPNMPTGAQPDLQRLQAIVDLCVKHHILLVNDNPYAHILTEKPFSIFQLTNAEKVGIELHSMSKTFNLAGCRIGFAVGKKEFLDAITKVSTQMESGMFLPQQEAAAAILKNPNDWLNLQTETYAKRRSLVWKLCDHLQLDYQKDAGGLFVWAKIKEDASLTNAENWVDIALEKYHFFVCPGSVFGSNGAPFVRFSLCQSEAVIEECIQRVKNASLKDTSFE